MRVQQHSGTSRNSSQQQPRAAAAGSTVLAVFVKVWKQVFWGQVGQVATSDGSMETWTIGRNLPACLALSGLTAMEAQIIGTLFENITHLPDPLRMQAYSHMMHGHDHTQHGAQRGGLGVHMWKGLPRAC